MRNLIFFLSITLLALSGTIYAASELHHHGFFWADQICGAAPDLCHEPFYLGAVTGAAVAAYLVLRRMET